MSCLQTMKNRCLFMLRNKSLYISEFSATEKLLTEAHQHHALTTVTAVASIGKARLAD